MAWGGALDFLKQLFPSKHPRMQAAKSNQLSRFIEGMQFVATAQLRTPLALLRRDGMVLHPDDVPEPDYPYWAGIWTLKGKTTTFTPEMIKAMQDSECRATAIGPQKTTEYMPFLIRFREVVESADTKEIVLREIEAMRANPLWNSFISLHGGAELMLRHSDVEK